MSKEPRKPRKPRAPRKPKTTDVPESAALATTEAAVLALMRRPRRKKISQFEIVIPADFELTPEFAQAFNRMENTRDHLFITGRAGTGKSTLLQYFRAKTGKNFVVLAPTGAAAVNVGGATIHSFFRFPPRYITRQDIHPVPEKAALFKNLDAIIIDEVSMVRADVMEAIDYALRMNRAQPGVPFGGVQLILIGDLYQLPPVVEQSLTGHFDQSFGSSYFFGAPALQQIELDTIELRRIFRQTDPEFIRILNNVRSGKPARGDLDILNARHNPYLSLDAVEMAITLTSTNEQANRINAAQLRALEAPEQVYEAGVTGNFDERSFPTDARLWLKPGAQVMMVRNDFRKRWVNGSLGTIHRISPELVEVAIGGEIFPVEQAIWEKIDYQYDSAVRRIEPVVTGSFRQYPIKLAWAITIHKSQGKTFDRVIIDFGRGAFATGQAYVALSRCRTLEGIQLCTPIRERDIMMDERVTGFFPPDLDF